MIFYTPDIEGDRYTLNEEESGHAVRVLRLAAGSEVELVDGRGGWYRAAVSDPHPKRCEVVVLDTQHLAKQRPYRLHIGMAPTKNIERFEWFIEKAVEIGIDEITPFLCEHSERKHINPERVQRIAVAAMKQSKKAYLPQMNEMLSFGKWLEATSGKSYIAYCGQADKQLLKSAYQPGNDAIVAIGPEGDFSPSEVGQALACGFECVSLGDSRLRTETAGVVVCHSLYFMNEF